MIFVDRADVPYPELLRSRPVVDERSRVLSLLQSAGDAHLAQLRVSFDSSVWKGLHSPLLALFKGKCAYCESRIGVADGGDIEHYRPKENAVSGEGSELEPSHSNSGSSRQHLFYAWLAYEWDNLLLACASCNRRRMVAGELVGKANLFPVAQRRAPYLASVAECRGAELPLLLDPCFDDPTLHLACGHDGVLLPLTERGRATIQILGLNLREPLVRERQEAWLQSDDAIEGVFRARGPEDEVASTQRLAHALSAEQPYHLARRSALQARSEELGAANRPEFLIRWPKPRNEDAAFVAVTAANPVAFGVPQTVTRPGKYAGRKMLPPFAFNRVRRIHIRNFKAIEELEIAIPEGPPDEANLPGALSLLGENAAGKTSVLEAVALALLGTQQCGLLGIDFKTLVRREMGSAAPDSPPPQPAQIVLHFDGEPGTEVRLTIHTTGRFLPGGCCHARTPSSIWRCGRCERCCCCRTQP
jgi:hypothetical protein